MKIGFDSWFWVQFYIEHCLGFTEEEMNFFLLKGIWGSSIVEKSITWNAGATAAIYKPKIAMAAVQVHVISFSW
jgi:hypothetical protein